MGNVELKSLWVLEWHPDGAVDVRPIVEAVERNGRAFLDGAEKGYVLLGLFPTMETALEGKRTMMRRRKERKEGVGCKS